MRDLLTAIAGLAITAACVAFLVYAVGWLPTIGGLVALGAAILWLTRER